MIIGNGLVAKAFNSYKDSDRYILFASGVSNSTCTDKQMFDREEKMLKGILFKNPEKIFIYFSTCSIYDVTSQISPYVEHKLAMENIIVTSSKAYHIFRVSNLVGYSTNPYTILNYFVHHILSGTFFYLWKGSSRNIIDIDDAFLVCDYIIKNSLFINEIVNIANQSNYRVVDIVQVVELFTKKKGNYELIERTSNPIINIDAIKDIFSILNITFDANYLERIIHKYFSINDI